MAVIILPNGESCEITDFDMDRIIRTEAFITFGQELYSYNNGVINETSLEEIWQNVIKNKKFLTFLQSDSRNFFYYNATRYYVGSQPYSFVRLPDEVILHVTWKKISGAYFGHVESIIQSQDNMLSRIPILVPLNKK